MIGGQWSRWVYHPGDALAADRAPALGIATSAPESRPRAERTRYRAGLAALASLVIAVLVLTSLPSRVPPSRDSGVFLYTGEQILLGQVPYRDVWDHKGPAIYYIDAFGLWLGHGSRWGVFLLEIVAVLVAAVLGYHMLSATFGWLPGSVASLLWVACLPLLLTDPGLTEEFALPFQFAAVYWFWRSRGDTRGRWRAAGAIGLALAGAFLLKPTYIGLPGAVLLVMVAQAFRDDRWRLGIAEASTVLAVAGLMCLGVAGYLSTQGALRDALDAILRYNRVYTAAPLRDRLDSVWSGLRQLTSSGLSILGLGGWILGGVHLSRRDHGEGRRESLLQVAFVGLPLEVALTSLSGRTYLHYYIAWLPVLAILAAGALAWLRDGAGRSAPPVSARALTVGSAGLVLVSLATGIAMNHASGAKGWSIWRPSPATSMANEITGYLRAGDPLLMWGAEAEFNFLTGRGAPGRFVYQYPLYECDFARPEMIAEFADAIRRQHPVIVDTSAWNPVVPPVERGPRMEWQRSQPSCPALLEMGRVADLIEAQYWRSGEVGPMHWPVYTWHGG